MSNNIDAANVNETETATTTTQVPTAKKAPAKAKAKAPAKAKAKTSVAIVETPVEKAPKEKAPRLSKMDKVQNEVCKQFGISETQFWKFVANHKSGKMNNNKFADSIVQRAFFEREKLAEQLIG